MDKESTISPLIGTIIAILILIVNYFIFIKPILRRRYFKNNGIRLSPPVSKITKTHSSIGDGSFAEPVYEIVFEYQYNGRLYRVSKNHPIASDEGIPRIGEKMDIIIDPNKPEDIMIVPYAGL